ncbi:MAG TPA: hypothetical protein VH109_11490 [Steroidobacteraceae bacterium]|jgi:hypothetical protein|nr:hypothetical protein [Steroidobacteraceae bacterium]
MGAAAPCALGLAPHSGWAAAVVLGGSAQEPKVLARERLELADATLEGSRAPYHAVEPLPLPRAREALARYEAQAESLARARLAPLLERTGGVRAAGILAGEGRGLSDLAAILASHALIHTADGNHFRSALARSLEALQVPVSRVRQRELLARAAESLGRREAELTARVAALGRDLGPPWGADQKAAALLAWLLLA